MQRPDLKPQLSALPRRTGVYRFLDGGDTVLYVGKAVDLRARVRSYFHESAATSHKTRRLVTEVADLDWIVTRSDLEALLLEMNLIKAHRPRYNVLLKDDKQYPYIRITWSDRFPTAFSTRNVRDDGSRYFGPYTSAAAVRDTLSTLRRVFPYLDCSRTITGRDERSCLYHDLGMCLAPCVGAVDQATYRAMIGRLADFLDGRSDAVLAELRAQMADHAARMEYELAARVRDRLRAVERVVERQRVIAPTCSDQDVIAVARDDGSAVAQVFFVRDGKLSGREYFQLDGAEDVAEGEVLASFIKQFYNESAAVPGEIVVPQQVAESRIIEHWLADRRGTKVRIAVPKRGHKRDLLHVAMENAAETLRALQVAHKTETESGAARAAMDELADALGLAGPLSRIECFDVSHLQGTHTVGSMVVFGDAAPLKQDYRHFRIRAAGGQDDYAAMGEMLRRRFQRLALFREADRPVGRTTGAFERSPDLVLLDGGKGQLRVGVQVLQSLGLDDVPVAALAKREESLFRPGRAEPVRLPRDSRALHLVQRARDEAHRFAVSYNRKLRRELGLRSSLDDVPGVGPARRRALLAHFGTLDAIRAASVDDLAALPVMTRRVAEQVKAYL